MMMARSRLGYTAREFWRDTPRTLFSLINKWVEIENMRNAPADGVPASMVAPIGSWAI